MWERYLLLHKKDYNYYVLSCVGCEVSIFSKMAFTHRQLRNTCEKCPRVQWIRHSQLGAMALPKEYLATP